MPTYGWQSKRYTFGAARDEEASAPVVAAVQPGLPSRLIATASYYIGYGDTLRIVARFGGVRPGNDPAATGTPVTVAVTSLGVMTFSATQSFKFGHVILINNVAYPIRSGSGTTYQTSKKNAAKTATAAWSVISEVVLFEQQKLPLPEEPSAPPLEDPPGINLFEEELDLAEIGTSLLPDAEEDWYVSFRIEITSEYRDPTPESVDWPFVNNEPVELYLYRNLQTQIPEIRFEETDVSAWRSNQVTRVTATPTYMPLVGVQAIFYFKDVQPAVRAATITSDSTGLVKTSLPPAQYDVHFYGQGFTHNEWLVDDNALTVGVGASLTPWRGNATSGVSQAAEFNAIKSQFATLYWPGYVIAEDFAPARNVYRDEEAEVNAYGESYALQLFGRVFAGKSYVDYFGLAIDPPPE